MSFNCWQPNTSCNSFWAIRRFGHPLTNVRNSWHETPKSHELISYFLLYVAQIKKWVNSHSFWRWSSTCLLPVTCSKSWSLLFLSLVSLSASFPWLRDSLSHFRLWVVLIITPAIAMHFVVWWWHSPWTFTISRGLMYLGTHAQFPGECLTKLASHYVLRKKRSITTFETFVQILQRTIV